MTTATGARCRLCAAYDRDNMLEPVNGNDEWLWCLYCDRGAPPHQPEPPRPNGTWLERLLRWLFD